ncbi:MAG: spermidine/putrescine ABC transporter substrate-binding protein [Clostridia bacterium]
MIKKLCLSLVLCLVFSCFSVISYASEISTIETTSTYEIYPEGSSINVYNWGEYISNGTDDCMDINAEFTKLTGIEVNYTTFDSNESLYAKLAGGGADYDIIIPSDYMISKLISEDMLAELNFENIPNFEYIDEEFVNPDYDPENKYSVPYTWGLVGLFYNKEYVEEVPTSWSVLWDDRYSGKILMFDNPRDTFAIAEKMLGFSLNTTEDSELQEAAMKLKEQKDVLQGYVMDQIFDKMESGEAWLAPYYSGDAAILLEQNENIGFIFPEEGTNYFIDAICIPITSEKQELAEAYINFLTDPHISAANMEYVGYATPISAAKEFLDEEVVNNEIFYPSEETLEKTEVFVDLPDETAELLDTLWAEVKMGGPGDSITLILIIVGFLLVYIGIIFYKKRKRKKEES